MLYRNELGEWKTKMVDRLQHDTPKYPFTQDLNI